MNVFEPVQQGTAALQATESQAWGASNLYDMWGLQAAGGSFSWGSMNVWACAA